MAFDLGIDMGSSHTRIYLKKHGLVVDEPSLVIVNNSGQAIAIGDDASEMIGRTPDGVEAIRPVRNGVITSFQATVAMLKHFIKKAAGNPFLKVRVVIGVPSGITEVERRAVEEAVKNAGAKDVYMIEEPLAAALGCGVDLTEPKGTMIADVGAGVTEVAVVSLGGIVVSQSVRIAGETFDNDIVQYVKKNFNMVVGDVTAENLKMAVGAAIPFKNSDIGEMKGRDSVSGLPKTIAMTSNEISEALTDSVNSIVDVIKSTLEKTPPELAADILQTGIILTGGGARLRGLGKLIQVKTEIPVYIAEEPMECAAIGAGKSLENMNSLKYRPSIDVFRR